MAANSSALTNRHLRSLTMDDTKVLGKSTAKRLSKAVTLPQFQTKMFNTYNSNWTPLVHRASNEQIYKERRELICNWFDLWTDSQRRRFLEVIFYHCRQKQLYFVQSFFNEHIPLKSVDPARVLPRFLTLHIFSFLDPRSLSRAAMVCWNWKFLSEQDVLWERKAVKFGWFLPYTPSENEYGAWKRHYVACIKTLDMDVMSQRNGSDLYGTISDGYQYRNGRKTAKLAPGPAQEIIESRPAWQPPDKNPKDLQRSAQALLEECNPNDPKVDSALLIHTDKFGMPRKAAMRQSEPALQGVLASSRKQTHRILTSEQDGDPHGMCISRPLSHSLKLESFEERRMLELTNIPWDSQTKATTNRRPDLSGGGAYPLPWKHGGNKQAVSKSYPSNPHPRIILISSRVPAADLLVDAVNFGIIPIVYEYEGTTLDSLMSQLELCLQGRLAQSIGLFTHSNLPWELCLVDKSVVTADNMDHPEFLEFFKIFCTSVRPIADKGHVDIFAPLGSCEPGKEMLREMSALTGMQFSSPMGHVGNYNHIDSQWMSQPEGVSPPTHYFCESKLSLWSSAADQVKEACKVTKAAISRFFDQKQRDVVSQLTGQIVFDTTGKVAIHKLEDISKALSESLLALGEEQNVKDPLRFLGNHLLKLSGATSEQPSSFGAQAATNGTLTPAGAMSAKTLTAALQLDEHYEESLDFSGQTTDDGEEGSPKRRKDLDNRKLHDSEREEEIDEEIIVDEVDAEAVLSSGDPPKHKAPIKAPKPVNSDTLPWSTSSREFPQSAGLKDSMKDSRVSFGVSQTMRNEADEQPEKRAIVANEILSTEVAYMRTLLVIKDVFFMPCKAALDSNRAVVSNQNLQVIFTDVLTLLDLSKSLMKDLQGRLSDWGPHQCLGDIFLKFSINLKAYINFMNNYPTILSTLEKSLEQSPLFRSLLKRRERTAASKMLTLAELFLAPTRRIGEFVTLLTWFQSCTPPDHADKNDLSQAIKIYGRLENFISECKLRCERERELQRLQLMIYACPILLEANRYFVKQLDVARLKPPTEDVVLELRVYQHVETLGLFLFNDSMIVTKRTVKHFPFERSSVYNYKFDTCISLSRMRVEELPDSKFVKHAFRLFTPRRSWVCAADDFTAKFNFVTLVENTIKASLSSDA